MKILTFTLIRIRDKMKIKYSIADCLLSWVSLICDLTYPFDLIIRAVTHRSFTTLLRKQNYFICNKKHEGWKQLYLNYMVSSNNVFLLKYSTESIYVILNLLLKYSTESIYLLNKLWYLSEYDIMLKGKFFHVTNA